MRIHRGVLLLSTALVLACVDQPTEPIGIRDLPMAQVSETVVTQSGEIPPSDQLAARVTGAFVSSLSSWDFLFEKMVIRNLDAWVDRAGKMGGSYEVEVHFTGGGGYIVSQEEVVCLSVDPATRQAWIVSARPDEEWGIHYSILQMKDLSPPAMSEIGRSNSGHYDLYAGRTTPPWEEGSGPEFCLLQPDLPQIPVEIPGGDPFPAMQLFPIDPGGDLTIHLGGR